ncbi:T-cell immunomodulatory protein [Bulinus truncatus]|nr:T-cell immunomodulatory protein [Bulinus truncatus]
MTCKHINNLLLVYLLLISNNVIVYSSLSDVTSDVFDKQPFGLIAAFGDLDADKAADIFVLSNDGKTVLVFKADIDIRRDGTKFIQKTFIPYKENETEIVALVPGDFNADSQMDLLVMRKSGDSDSSVKVEIFNGNSHDGIPFLKINEIFRDQPIVIDANGDMIPDLFGETIDKKRAVWTFNSNESYEIQYYHDSTGRDTFPPLKIPHSSAFLDLDGDLNADLCVVSEDNQVVIFEFWLNKDGNLTWMYNISAPPELKIVGQASFVDFNANHEINIVLPGCLDESCKKSEIFVWSYNASSQKATDGIWYNLNVEFQSSDNEKDTSFPINIKPTSWLQLPIMLRFGDFNLDGYPDAIAILSDSKSSNNKSAFILYNEPCKVCQGFSRTLSIDFRYPLAKKSPALVAFYDLMENGVLDILLTEVNDDGTIVIRAIEQDFTGDASFLKVLVVSGLCKDNCPNGHNPYGVNQVGPTAKFISTTPTGNDQICVASQLTQSAYFSLQLPFMLFGLGQTPNFVDELKIGIPSAGSGSRSHSWSTIIPNSQVIVIPYPINNPESWKHELYVTPSRLVLLTGASLLGTCAFIAAIVGLLHWRERIEDKREKLQEAQRFHFDAILVAFPTRK